MKPILILIGLILTMTPIAYGDAFFETSPLSGLQVIQADPGDGAARIAASGAGDTLVHIGDSIGRDGAVITQIRRLYIVVKTTGGTTRLPVIRASSMGSNCIVFQ